MFKWETVDRTSMIAFSRITFKVIDLEIMLKCDVGLGIEAPNR